MITRSFLIGVSEDPLLVEDAYVLNTDGIVSVILSILKFITGWLCWRVLTNV